MKEKDCDKTQILNPKTKRCIGKNTKQALEILFNKNDKQVRKLYEMVNGKIVKKCDKPKIRNPETNRCVNKIKEIKKPKINSLDLKINAIKRAKKALSPFINRVSADIYRRNKYLVLMRRELNKRKNTKSCMKVYKENEDGSFQYRIGNKIILKKRIGSDSVYGIVYLSEFREKTKKLFTFASKVYKFKEDKTKYELELLTTFTNLVRKDICPHFPITYGYVICDDISDFNYPDSFIKSNSKDKSISQRINKLPDLINQYKSQSDKKFITTFNELANGDLWTFFRMYGGNTKLLLNALIQQFFAIIFFYNYTERFHTDTHAGNFLFYKVKAGGYFHYKLFGKDYYLENLGFLWVIWDYDLSYPIKSINRTRKYNIMIDFLKLAKCYRGKDKGGFNPIESIIKNAQLDLVLNNFISNFILSYNNSYEIYYLTIFINNIPNEFMKFNKIIPKILLETNMINGKLKIINKNPYVISSDKFLVNLINKKPNVLFSDKFIN